MVACRFPVLMDLWHQEATRMLLGKRFESFVQGSPVSVMVRGILVRTFDPARSDALFENTAETGYTRKLLFSTTVRLMSGGGLGNRAECACGLSGRERPSPATETGKLIYGRSLSGSSEKPRWNRGRSCSRTSGPPRRRSWFPGGGQNSKCANGWDTPRPSRRSTTGR
jgi:hypothetical protein